MCIYCVHTHTHTHIFPFPSYFSLFFIDLDLLPSDLVLKHALASPFSNYLSNYYICDKFISEKPSYGKHHHASSLFQDVGNVNKHNRRGPPQHQRQTAEGSFRRTSRIVGVRLFILFLLTVNEAVSKTTAWLDAEVSIPA